MAQPSDDKGSVRYDRDLLLHGAKRNEVLTLAEVRQYGTDSYGDPNYVKVYGETPPQWYERGIRLLGRTVVECTRDELGDRIGRDIARVATEALSHQSRAVIDPFGGSCNTLFWILRHLPGARGIAFELDKQVHELTERNLALLDQRITLYQGDYQSRLPKLDLAPDSSIVAFVAPPWGKALDEVKGLDLSRTIPPITDIIGLFERTFPTRKLLFAVQVYEKLDPTSVAEVQALLDWSELCVYNFNAAGKNHGLLLGTKGWLPQIP